MKRKRGNVSSTHRRRSHLKGTAAGREIIGALTELAEALESGESLEKRFTVRTVQLPDDPSPYDPAKVRATRDRVTSSQAVFARLLGVSTVLVQHWEGGARVPAKWARRLLDEMNRDPRHWQAMLRQSQKTTSAA